MFDFRKIDPQKFSREFCSSSNATSIEKCPFMHASIYRESRKTTKRHFIFVLRFVKQNEDMLHSSINKEIICEICRAFVCRHDFDILSFKVKRKHFEKSQFSFLIMMKSNIRYFDFGIRDIHNRKILSFTIIDIFL